MFEADRIRLRHMRDAMSKSVALTRGRSRQDLDADEVLGLALVRLLEIVGEAAKKVSEPVRAKYPQVPWKRIAGTRDRLIHGYDDVDLDIVWNIITRDLPAVLATLEELLAVEEG